MKRETTMADGKITRRGLFVGAASLVAMKASKPSLAYDLSWQPPVTFRCKSLGSVAKIYVEDVVTGVRVPMVDLGDGSWMSGALPSGARYIRAVVDNRCEVPA
jgi:hypothetical protein